MWIIISGVYSISRHPHVSPPPPVLWSCYKSAWTYRLHQSAGLRWLLPSPYSGSAGRVGGANTPLSPWPDWTLRSTLSWPASLTTVELLSCVSTDIQAPLSWISGVCYKAPRQKLLASWAHISLNLLVSKLLSMDYLSLDLWLELSVSSCFLVHVKFWVLEH